MGKNTRNSAMHPFQHEHTHHTVNVSHASAARCLLFIGDK